MSIADSHCKDGILYFLPKGRIDTSNASTVETEMNATLDATPHETLIVDAVDLQYISSAGLRVILRMRKREKTMRIINVLPEVYDIFEITGFSEMIPIEKT